MKRRKQFYATALLIMLLLSGKTQAQSQFANNNSGNSLTVTASVTNQQVRFTATSVMQLRLEVYNSSGKKLFDNELRGGNVLDWHLLDGQAQPLADDTYLCVVTLKSLSGRITQRLGSVKIEQQTAKLQDAAASQMTPQQLEAIGPVEENAFFTPVEADQQPASIILAHDGEDGQLTRGRGALSFRLGDFYSGKDTEQMRLTAEGNLGIGTANPQARLDVNGLIRTTQGIVFPDGTIQTTAAFSNQSDQKSGDKPEGSISQLGKIGKTGKAGKRDQSVSPEFNINEDLTINGNIIFTPPSPQFARDITMTNNNGGLRFYGAPSLTNSPAAAAIQFWGNNSPFPGQMYLDSGAHDSAAVILRTTGTGGTITERMRVTATGNVGIGVTTPAAKLDVAGTINASTQYNIGGQPVLSVAGGVNLFVGESAGHNNTDGHDNTFVGHHTGFLNTTGIINTFVGASTGLSNTTGSSNSFFGVTAGYSNTTGSENTFVSRSAGFNNTTGNGNTFIGRSAGFNNTVGDNNTAIGKDADVSQNNLIYATAVGAGAVASNSNSIVLGRASGADAVRIPGAVLIDGSLVVHTLGSAGSTQLCLNAADRLAPCSSSLRYKTNVQSFFGGLDIVKRLRPITFDWKEGGLHDLGFGAEEVEKIEPLLTIRNQKGEIEGVKYGQLTTVLVNAVKEQQAQIDQYQTQFAAQQSELAALKQLLCRNHPKAAVCQSARRLKK